MAKTAAKAASCTAAGNSEYYQCNHCHKFFSDELGNNEITENSWVIPATAHTFDVDYPEIKTLGTYRHAYHHCSECDKLYMLDENSQYVEIADDDAAWENALCQYNDTEFVSSESNPYIIKYDADIIFLRNHTNAEANDTFEGKFLKMVNDIDLQGSSTNPFGTPIGTGDAKPFSGTFDGNGHTIDNLYLRPIVISETTTRSDALALFSRVTGGTVKNLNLNHVDISGVSQRAAAFCSRAFGATFENCKVLGGTINGDKQSGGIVGASFNTTTIVNCVNNADVGGSGVGYGGIVGYDFSGSLTIKNCVNNGQIGSTGSGSAGLGSGGIMGTSLSSTMPSSLSGETYPSATIIGCVNNGVINSQGEATGGIAGQFANPANQTGVFIARNCINNGSVSGKSNGTGGILGSSYGATTISVRISYCNNYGEVTGALYVGGIAGLPRKNDANSTIANCVNAGNVTATSSYCGGITGLTRCDLSNCVSLGTTTLTIAGTSAVADTLEAAGGAKTTPGYLTGTKEASANNSPAAIAGSKALPYEISVIIPSGWEMTDITEGNAQIFVYYWGGALGAQWVLATVTSTNTVEAIVPADATGMKVVRINPEAGAPSWDEGVCWNQSNADITIAPATFTYSTTLQ